MKFNKHEDLENQHAFLSASKYHWLRWEDETLEKRFFSQYAQILGTAIHELAKDLINQRTRLNDADSKFITYHMSKLGIPRGAYDPQGILLDLMYFVNDAIGYRMSSEVLLYYSRFCFGTTDAIVFDEYEKILRIHDLKTGETPVKFEQLVIYAALFCLEYKKNPMDFRVLLRIYQKGQVLDMEPSPAEIEGVMKLIIDKDKKLINILESGL